MFEFQEIKRKMFRPNQTKTGKKKRKKRRKIKKQRNKGDSLAFWLPFGCLL